MVTGGLPTALRGTFFEGEWETTRIWALETPVERVPLGELLAQLTLPVWSTVRGEARFDLSPADVLAAPVAHLRHWQRLILADPEYPLELFESPQGWLIVDGYHRLAKLVLEGAESALVRRHPAAVWPRVARAPRPLDASA